jgi:haloacetate dehalogenase
MYEGFATHDLPTDRGPIHARVKGDGPPLLLLHGFPQTHLIWHAVAPALAERFTVVAADLPGYGDSHHPAPAADHAPHSKRAMAADLIQAMAVLGHTEFAVAGHDRGGRVGYRMALDSPQTVTRLAVLDIVPTGELWARADDRLALGYWHWGFLAQPAPLPEELILGAPGVFADHPSLLGHHVERVRAGDPGFPPQALADYAARLADRAAVQAMCEDYRASATIDRAHDEADHPSGSGGRGRRIECPVLVLWAARGGLPIFYDDVLGIWSAWAADLRGEAVDATHYIPEDSPGETAERLAGFFTAGAAA